MLLGATALFVQNEVTTIPEEKTVQMGWPLPWIEMVTTMEDVNGTTVYSVAYNILWGNLFVDVAAYVAVLLLIFG